MTRNSKECDRRREIARQQKDFRLNTPAISFPTITSYKQSVFKLRTEDERFAVYSLPASVVGCLFG
jgi:hypothetical protein